MNLFTDTPNDPMTHSYHPKSAIIHPQFRGILLLTIVLSQAAPVLPQDVPHEEKLSCSSLPHMEAESLTVDIHENNAVWLEGWKQKRVLWRRRFPLHEPVNRAKTYPSCKEHTIELDSQAPFSAFTTVQTFNWDGVHLRYVSTWHEDPSASAIEKLIREAAAGHPSVLRSGEMDSILYPAHYIGGPLLVEAIRRGHDAAVKLYHSGKPRLAAERQALLFDLTLELSRRVTGSQDHSRREPDRWIRVWKEQEVQPADYLGILNDYGYFLQKAGQNALAIRVFRSVIKESPMRAAAYLNLADSLWTLNHQAEARRYYVQYQQLMQAAHKEDKLPLRVTGRLSKGE